MECTNCNDREYCIPDECNKLSYDEFIESKNETIEACGFAVGDLNPNLFDFQEDIVRWALHKGRAAIFADCGLGKTIMQLAWADAVYQETLMPVLILAPLAVASQTKLEGASFGIPVNVCETADDVVEGINITNYEKLDRFDTSVFSGVVLDESSILKSFTGKVRTALIEQFKHTPYRLACTATPAPNDFMELGNHAEFLGIMTRNEMLSMYFIHDSKDTAKWRLKGHAQDLFWEWMASWAVVLDNPISLGYTAEGYDLPTLHIHEVVVGDDGTEPPKLTLLDRKRERKKSLEDRCVAAAEIVNESNEQWIVWCDLNDESDALARYIDGAIDVKGSDKPAHKQGAMLGFGSGLVKCLVTKPSIAGFGMNWQNCHNMIFVGLSDSYEQYYQALRRCWRFGQKEEVHAYIIISHKEGAVKDNIERKDAENRIMRDAMIDLTRDAVRNELTKTKREKTLYVPTIEMKLPPWQEMGYL